MSCRFYVIWGDVIRGCYRRYQGGRAPQLEESDREEDVVESGAQSDDPTEDMTLAMSVMPTPVKSPRARIMEDEAIKRPRGRPPKKRIAPNITGKRADVAAGKDSEDENFDIGGYTDLDNSDSGVEHRPPKPTLATQRKGTHLQITVPYDLCP